MATPPLYILVRLWIHRGREAEFEAYERKVSRIMARYGGVIEHSIMPSTGHATCQDSEFVVDENMETSFPAAADYLKTMMVIIGLSRESDSRRFCESVHMCWVRFPTTTRP